MAVFVFFVILLLSMIAFIHLLECKGFNEEVERVAAELGLTAHGRIGLKGLTGEVQDVPIEASFGGARDDRNMTIRMEPFGLPPEIHVENVADAADIRHKMQRALSYARQIQREFEERPLITDAER